MDYAHTAVTAPPETGLLVGHPLLWAANGSYWAAAWCHYTETQSHWRLLGLFSKKKKRSKNKEKKKKKPFTRIDLDSNTASRWPHCGGVTKYGSPEPVCCPGLIVPHCVVFLRVCAGGKLTGSQSHSVLIYNLHWGRCDLCLSWRFTCQTLVCQ